MVNMPTPDAGSMPVLKNLFLASLCLSILAIWRSAKDTGMSNVSEISSVLNPIFDRLSMSFWQLTEHNLCWTTYVEVRLCYCLLLAYLYIITKYYVAKKFNSCYDNYNIVTTRCCHLTKTIESLFDHLGMLVCLKRFRHTSHLSF